LTRGFLAEALAQAKEKFSFDLWTYVFMPEHVHLLIRPRNPEYSISDILRAVKHPVGRRAVLHLRRRDPKGLRWLATGNKAKPYRFWMPGGGYDRNLMIEPTLRGVVEYIHANPVRRGLVERPTEWVWSSAGEWAGMRKGPVEVDKGSMPA
jgi:putative transposase